mgnify:CR=1 FL=1
MPCFDKLTINQPDDYEGPVVCTLLRKPTNTNTGKAVLYVHGFNDYFFNSEIADCFTTQGFNFYALDLRKSGRSLLPLQKLNNLRNINEYFEDISAALKIMADEGCTKLLLYGHSMGGLVTALYVSQYEGNGLIKAVFLNSPFFEMNENWITRKLLVPLVSVLARTMPNVPVPGRFSRFYGPSLHESQYGEWAYNLNWKPHMMPLVNMGWIRAVYHAQNQVKKGIIIKQAVMMMCPVKSVKGRKWNDAFRYGDAILNVDDMIKYARGIKGNCEIITLEGAVHDVMLSVQPVRQEAFQILLEWVNKVM